MTVAEGSDVDQVAAFLDELEASDNTRRAYRQALGDFALWFEATNGEPFAAAAATPTDVREYRAHLLTVRRAAAATVNQRLAALRRFFAWSEDRGDVDGNAARRIRGVERQKLAPKWLGRRDLNRFLRTVERHGDRRDLVIVELLRHTGLRVGELAALDRPDVELRERSGRLHVRQGKGAKERWIPLNRDVRPLLVEHIATLSIDQDALFVGGHGTRRARLSANAVYDLVVKYARLAGLDDVTPHTLRHTFAKALVDAGENLVTIAALLGHEDLDTVKIYTQPGELDLSRAVEKLAD